MSAERWKPVVGFEGSYEVSDLGRVRSCERTILDSVSRKRRLRSIIRAVQTRSDGYCVVNLSVRGEVTLAYVHDLVLRAFVGAPESGRECRHLNGTRCDNRLENLAYGTRIENQADRVRHGTDMRGDSAPWSILSEANVRSFRGSCEPARLLAAKHGVAKTTVNDARSGRSWRHV